MKKYLIDVFSEDMYESFGSFDVDEVSEIKESIAYVEETTGQVADFILLYNESDDNSTWYVLDENVSLHEADEELASELDEEYGDDFSELIESESGWFEDLLMEEVADLDENQRRRVTSKGSVSRIKSRKVRRRTAQKTTGMTRSALKRRARKSARSKKRNPGGQRRALRKRGKAMRKRRQMGIKRGS